jgi:hypothetical protein
MAHAVGTGPAAAWRPPAPRPLPALAGLDKFFHLLGNWDQYLAPVVAPATTSK